MGARVSGLKVGQVREVVGSIKPFGFTHELPLGLRCHVTGLVAVGRGRALQTTVSVRALEKIQPIRLFGADAEQFQRATVAVVPEEETT